MSGNTDEFSFSYLNAVPIAFNNQLADSFYAVISIATFTVVNFYG